MNTENNLNPSEEKTVRGTDTPVYQGKLHWIIFVKAIAMVIFGFYVQFRWGRSMAMPLIGIGCFWGIYLLLDYLNASLEITPEFISMQTGILVRQNLTVSRRQLESVDVTQSVLGSIFNYGHLSVHGTGGTRFFFSPIADPLTCRRFIETFSTASSTAT